MISNADKRQFFDQGYLVVEGVVPEANCRAVRAAVCEFLGVSEEDPETWRKPNIQGHGIVPLHHAQALWDVRQLPRIHAAFAALYDAEDLWVSVDRVSFKAPASISSDSVRVDPIHWDGDPRVREGLSIQGLVYLTDTDPEQGGFCCIPDLYRGLDEWLAEHAGDDSLRRPDVSGYEVQTVGAPAGSLVMWHRRLPHSSARNDGNLPRWTQYVAMEPAGDEQARQQLVALYREKRPPQWAVRQHVRGQQIPEPGEPAQLTDLGRRLVGLSSW
jgi:ectoine hydroxylase-related dioxygenase (phytanoyl-CoA dioxygenase family)